MPPCLPDLTVLVPVKDDRRLERCLSSVDVDCELVLSLNGATPEFERWARRLAPRATVVSTPQPGLGRAYNLGLEACRTEFALLMDSDCVFAPGTIIRLRRGLDGAALSKGRVVFEHRGPCSRAVARYREHHTSDEPNAYSPPLALSRTAVKLLLGHYFDEHLTWSEDFEFDARVRRAGLRIHHDREAVVHHPPLSVRQDLRAAWNYGQGYAVGEKRALFPPLGFRPRERWARHLRHARQVLPRKGAPAALYSVLWREAFWTGYRAGLR